MPNTVPAAAEGLPNVNAIFVPVTHEAEAKMRAVKILTEKLRERMEEIHGEAYRMHIDHATGFILVAQRTDERPANPKRGGELV